MNEKKYVNTNGVRVICADFQETQERVCMETSFYMGTFVAEK